MLTGEEEEKKEEFSFFSFLLRHGKKLDEKDSQTVMEHESKPQMTQEPTPELIERYTLGSDELASIAITLDPKTKQCYYNIEEPEISKRLQKIINEVEKIFVYELKYDPAFVQDSSLLKKYLKESTDRALKRYRIRLTEEEGDILRFYLNRNYFGYGPVDLPMKDPNIEDISCDGVGLPVYIWHRKYESLPTNIVFKGMDELDDFVSKLAHVSGKHISVAFPIVDAELPDRSRLATTYRQEVSHKGSSFTVRKFRSSPFTIVDLLSFGTLDLDMAAYFWFLIENKKSIIVAGSTASGKTTTINALATFIHPKYRVITIEDTAELNLPHEHCLPLVARSGFGFAGEKTSGEITLFDLLKASLRHRPDYIIVGEIRGEEAYVLFQAMATGHGGICTIHSGSVDEVTKRLVSPPMNISPVLLPLVGAIAIQVPLVVKRKRTRKIIGIYEIVRRTEKDFETIPVFAYDPSKDVFMKMNSSSHIIDVTMSQGWSQDDLRSELQHRKTILKWLMRRKIHYYKDVGEVISTYYNDPLTQYKKAVGSLYPGLTRLEESQSQGVEEDKVRVRDPE